MRINSEALPDEAWETAVSLFQLPGTFGLNPGEGKGRKLYRLGCDCCLITTIAIKI
jgi:hypothetical protein